MILIIQLSHVAKLAIRTVPESLGGGTAVISLSDVTRYEEIAYITSVELKHKHKSNP